MQVSRIFYLQRSKNIIYLSRVTYPYRLMSDWVYKIDNLGRMLVLLDRIRARNETDATRRCATFYQKFYKTHSLLT